jgi:hypothetical protein
VTLRYLFLLPISLPPLRGALSHPGDDEDEDEDAVEAYPQARKRRLAERAAREDAEADERTEEVRAGPGCLGTQFSALPTHRLLLTLTPSCLRHFSPSRMTASQLSKPLATPKVRRR